MGDKESLITINELPMSFIIKYLGSHEAKGLWGIKYTRKPVDILISSAKNHPAEYNLPLVSARVSEDGVSITEITKEGREGEFNKFPVDTISYGVQDLVYTRVFSIITVEDQSLKSATPFMCHSFVCDSRDQARRLTYALAAVFQDYGRRMKEEARTTGVPIKRLTIDLRTPEEQAEGSDDKETDA